MKFSEKIESILKGGVGSGVKGHKSEKRMGEPIDLGGGNFIWPKHGIDGKLNYGVPVLQSKEEMVKILLKKSEMRGKELTPEVSSAISSGIEKITSTAVPKEVGKIIGEGKEFYAVLAKIIQATDEQTYSKLLKSFGIKVTVTLPVPSKGTGGIERADDKAWGITTSKKRQEAQSKFR